MWGRRTGWGAPAAPTATVLMPPLRLRVPLLEPPEAAHADTQRGEAVPLWPLPLRLSPARQPDTTHPHPHWREALPLSPLPLCLQQPGQPEAASAHPCRAPHSSLPDLWLPLLCSTSCPASQSHRAGGDSASATRRCPAASRSEPPCVTRRCQFPAGLWAAAG